MSIQPGQTILNSKYHILRLIGEGGMARVWLAEEPGFGGRMVAIKEPLLAQLGPDEHQELERRFRQEIKLAPQLEQARVPNVVRTYTVECLPDGTQLLVMEYIEGGSLAERIAAQPHGLPIEQALSITQDVLRALDGFHRLPGAPVHRDVKPENILLDAQGRARLSDLGLAQLAGVSSRSQLMAGPHPGTPLYMAPEQGRGPDPLTPAADLYALGCVLFEMLTGKRYKRVRPGTAPSSLRPDVPRWLDDVVLKALTEDPWDRYQAAGEMATALRQPAIRARAAESVRREPTRAASSRGWVWVLAAIGLVVIAVGLGVGVVALLDGLSGSVPPTREVAESETKPSPTPTPTMTPAPAVLQAGDTHLRPADGMVMVYVPAGKFEMGTTGPPTYSAENPHPNSSEIPQHAVYLDAYWMDRTEVTNAQYQLCIEAGVCQAMVSCASGHLDNPNATAPDHPVTCVQWQDAQDYCRWSGGQLPTEAQWEKAARGTDGREYPWGNEFDATQLNGSDGAHCLITGCVGYEGDDGYAFTAPVGNYPSGASPYGALDMAGNVWEWVADWYDNDYYSVSPLQNPQGPDSGTLKIVRSGNWWSGGLSLRTWAKLDYDPAKASQGIGFRCSMSP